MRRELIIRIFVGALILISVLLAVFHNLNWLWLTGFVGLSLFQSGFTKWCPAEIILKAANIGKE